MTHTLALGTRICEEPFFFIVFPALLLNMFVRVEGIVSAMELRIVTHDTR